MKKLSTTWRITCAYVAATAAIIALGACDQKPKIDVHIQDIKSYPTAAATSHKPDAWGRNRARGSAPTAHEPGSPWWPGRMRYVSRPTQPKA